MMGFGQNSGPIWAPGTIEFIWAGWIPLKPHHNFIPPRYHFFQDHFFAQKSPQPKMFTQPFKISPESDFRCFPKSLQKERTANPSEILSRTHPSKPQTEPRSENRVFRIFLAKITSVVSETKHLRIISFGFWTLLGYLVSETQHFGISFGIWDPPGMSGALLFFFLRPSRAR